VAVTGTNTDVGKTYVASQLLSFLKREGLEVSARKPAQSYDPDEICRLDSEVLAAATGENSKEICSPDYTYPLALTPFMAKRELTGTELYMSELSGIVFQPNIDIGILEGAGGILSPICTDGDFIDLMEIQKIDLILCVADSTLGSLNSILTNYFGFRYQAEQRNYPHLINVEFVIYLNRFDDNSGVDMLNFEWLKENLNLPIYNEINELGDYVKTIWKMRNDRSAQT
jgi:dethiobiotin synthase